MEAFLKLLILTALTFQAAPSPAQEGPRVDVVFLLDATGSMGDEIQAVKDRIREMISDIALGEPAPDVRFGIVAYRDREDEYVTRTYPLTRNIDLIVENLDEIEATGGGDYPESLNEGLHTAVQEIEWDATGNVARLVFLIADAPPHMDYADDFDYRDEVQLAAESGIVIHAIGASGLDEEGERIFKEIAVGTQGQFQWLVYESRYIADDGEEVIVRVEGREATYTKGDSTWTTESDGAVLGGAGGREAAFDTDDAVIGGGAEPASDVTTSTNLDDLITSAIKDAAEEGGAEYETDPTAVRAATWAEAKAGIGR
tara:strand:- start:1 stop:942 length:942 start_codon:yes stop_codon:yes gene_type:complete